MRHVSTAIAWSTSGSTVNFTSAPHASTMSQTTSRIAAHSIVTTIQPVPHPLHPLRSTIPLLPRDWSTWYPLLWQTDFPLPFLDEPSEDLIIPVLSWRVFTPPPFNSAVFILPPQILMTMMFMTLTPGGTSMVIRVFRWCFNAIIGVILQLPVSFFPFCSSFHPLMPSSYTMIGQLFEPCWLCFFYFILSSWLWIYLLTSRIFSMGYSIVLPIVLPCSFTFSFLGHTSHSRCI